MKTDIMTLEEVAAYLKLKPQTIYTWAQEKKIPAAKLGKEWRVSREDLSSFIERHVNRPQRKTHLNRDAPDVSSFDQSS